MTKFHIHTTSNAKTNGKCSFRCAIMSMMMVQIYKFVDSSKTQKPKYLEHKDFISQEKIHSLKIWAMIYGNLLRK